MKKLLALLIASIAIYSQAASINWSLSQVKSSADSTKPGEGYLGLFFIVDTKSDPAVTVESITKLLNDDDAAGAVALASYSKTATTAGLISQSGVGSFATGTEVTAFAVVLDAGTAAAAKNYIITGTMTLTAPTTGAMKFSFGSQANNTTYSKVGAVPEPATGALALAGIALLFRRRK